MTAIIKDRVKNKYFLEQIKKFLPVFLLVGFTLLLLNSYLIDRHSYYSLGHMRPKDTIGFLSYIAEFIVSILIICSVVFIDIKSRSLIFLSVGFVSSVVLGILIKARMVYFICPIMVYGLCAYLLWQFLKGKIKKIDS